MRKSMASILYPTLSLITLLAACPDALSSNGDETEENETEENETQSEPSETSAAEQDSLVTASRSNASPYGVNPVRSITFITTGFLVATLPRMMINEFGSPPRCGLDCDVNDINAFDRAFMTPGSLTAANWSDALMYGSLTLPFIFDAIDVGRSKPEDGFRGFGIDALVLFETMGVSLWVNGLVAMIVQRPRPYVYDETNSDEFRLEPEAAMSFYSGHTSIVFAAATAYSRLFMLRHPKSKLIVPMWIVMEGLAGTVGALRVVSSAHFMSDVLVGAATGFGIGLLVPWIHELPGGRSDSNDIARVKLRPYFSGISYGFVGTFN